jgi:hypothetical protein
MKDVVKKLVFNSGINDLKKLIAALDSNAQWCELSNGIQYRGATGGILNFYPGTGTVMFQGSASAKLDLQVKFSELLGRDNEMSSKNMIRGNWPNIDFGKYAKTSMSLPQIVLHDPGWFFYVFGDGKYVGPWREQFLSVAEKAQAIRLPAAYVHYEVRHLRLSNGRYGGFRLMKKIDPNPLDREILAISSSLDISYAWRTFGMDAIAQQKLIRAFNAHYVGSGHLMLTKTGIEKLFDDDKNFDL